MRDDKSPTSISSRLSDLFFIVNTFELLLLWSARPCRAAAALEAPLKMKYCTTSINKPQLGTRREGYLHCVETFTALFSSQTSGLLSFFILNLLKIQIFFVVHGEGQVWFLVFSWKDFFFFQTFFKQQITPAFAPTALCQRDVFIKVWSGWFQTNVVLVDTFKLWIYIFTSLTCVVFTFNQCFDSPFLLFRKLPQIPPHFYLYFFRLKCRRRRAVPYLHDIIISKSLQNWRKGTLRRKSGKAARHDGK